MTMQICVSGSGSLRVISLLLFFCSFSLLIDVSGIDVFCALTPKLSLLLTERYQHTINSVIKILATGRVKRLWAM